MPGMTKSIGLPVQGMSCASCVAHVEGALKNLPGVSNVVVNLATNKASLSYDPAQVTIGAMGRAVDDVGYAVPTAELTLDVRGMTCASCVAHVEKALAEVEGVTGAVVNLGLATARVSYIPGVAAVSAMRRAVADAARHENHFVIVIGDAILGLQFAFGIKLIDLKARATELAVDEAIRRVNADRVVRERQQLADGNDNRVVLPGQRFLLRQQVLRKNDAQRGGQDQTTAHS